MEFEFIALEMDDREAEWLRNFVADVPLWEKPVQSILLHCDSQAAIYITKNKTYNGLAIVAYA